MLYSGSDPVLRAFLGSSPVDQLFLGENPLLGIAPEGLYDPPPAPYTTFTSADAATKGSEDITVDPILSGTTAHGGPQQFTTNETRQGVGLLVWRANTGTWYRSRVPEVNDHTDPTQVETLVTGGDVEDDRPDLEIVEFSGNRSEVLIGELGIGRLTSLTVEAYTPGESGEPAHARWVWDGTFDEDRAGIFTGTNLDTGLALEGWVLPEMGTIFLHLKDTGDNLLAAGTKFRAEASRDIYTGTNLTSAIITALEAGNNIWFDHSGEEHFLVDSIGIPSGREIRGQGSSHPDNLTERTTYLIQGDEYAYHIYPADEPTGTSMGQTYQQKLTVRGVHLRSSLGAINTLRLGAPGENGSSNDGKAADYHSIHINSVRDATLYDVVTQGALGDGIYFGGQSIKDIHYLGVTGAPDTATFTVINGGDTVQCGPGYSRNGRVVREGQVKPDNPLPADITDHLFWFRDNNGVEFAASTATRPTEGLAPLFIWPTWDGDTVGDDVVGYLDTIEGEAHFGVDFNGDPLTNGNAGVRPGHTIVAGSYEEYDQLACQRAVCFNTAAYDCLRNGYGHSGTEVYNGVGFSGLGRHLCIGNGLGGVQRINGKIARDWQMMSSRSPLELNNLFSYSSLELIGRDAGVKIGPEPGPFYPKWVVSFDHIFVKKVMRKAFDCGDGFMDVEINHLQIEGNGSYPDIVAPDAPIKFNPYGTAVIHRVTTRNNNPTRGTNDLLARIDPDCESITIGNWEHYMPDSQDGASRIEFSCGNVRFENPGRDENGNEVGDPIYIDFVAGTTNNVVVNPASNVVITGPHTVE